MNNNLDSFISSIEYGKDMKLSLKEADIDAENLKLWINKGRNNIEPYNEFVNSLDKAESICDKNKQDFQGCGFFSKGFCPIRMIKARKGNDLSINTV